MDWDLAIKRNSEALKGIIADLFAMLELAGLATVVRLPRSVHSAVLRVLRPGRIRRAAPDRHCRPRPCGEACSFASGLASQAGKAHGQGHREAAGLPLSNSLIRGNVSSLSGP